MQYCLSDKPEILNFEPVNTGLREYPITQFQPVYYAAESFEEAKVKMRLVDHWALTPKLRRVCWKAKTTFRI